VFAILGLRSLYFALAGMVTKFRYLKVSLALVLMIVGVKMLFADWLKLAIGKQFKLYLLRNGTTSSNPRSSLAQVFDPKCSSST